MARLLVLIGLVCAFSVATHGHRHVRQKRGVPYPAPSTPYYSPYGTYPSPDQRQWQPKSGAYSEVPQLEPMVEGPAPEMIREAIRETLMEAPREIMQETILEAPIASNEGLSLSAPAPQQEQLFDALMKVSHIPEQDFYDTVPQEQYVAPTKAPLGLERELYEHTHSMSPQMPGKELYEPAFLHAPPLKMQEALYDSPMNTYPIPRHSYPYPESYNQYQLRDSYHGDAYPWQKPAYFPEQYRSSPSSHIDLPNYQSELFYPQTTGGPSPAAFDPFKKPIIVDEVTKPLIVEHFQAPVVVDCYQKPIVISHFIPPIINDFYEAPEFVEKQVDLDLTPFLGQAPVQEPCPLLSRA